MKNIEKSMVNKKKAFLIDWDGTMFHGLNPVDGADKFFAFLTRIDARIIYLTNNSSRNTKEYVKILNNYNLWNCNCQVVTSGMVASWYIKDVLDIDKVFIVGTDSLIDELNDYGIKNTNEEAKLVLIGFDTSVTYDKIQRCHELISKGLPFYATHGDKVCPGINKTYVDCGSFIQIFKTSANRYPTIIGKPYKISQDYLLQKMNINPRFTFMIGDRVETDGKLANDMGIKFYQVINNPSSLFDIIETEITNPKNNG